MKRTKFSTPVVQKAKPGPKSKCKEKLKIAFQFALLGATNQMIANCIGVSVDTIDNWVRHDPEFAEALNRGKVPADAKVAHALYRSAIGYSHPDTVILTNTVKEYNDEGKVIRSYNEPLIVPTVKHYAPNAFAAFKWLTLRQKVLGWADTQNINITQDITVHGQIDFSDMNDDELLMLEKIGIKQITSKAAQRQLQESGRS